MLNTKSILLSILVFLSVIKLQAGPGDTIMIQTYEFDGYPVGEGWLSPREGFFDFTEVTGLNFEKVLMHYTLKCDPTQNPACGEWDYLSYIKVMEHTGIGYHPSYLIGGEGGFTPAEFSYMNDVSWKYESRFEETIVYDDPNALSEHSIGSGNTILSNPFDASLSGARSYYLFRADELTSAGLTAGDVTGMQFNISSLGDDMKRLNIRIKHTSNTELTENIDSEGFTTVFSKDSGFSGTGWQALDFTNFFPWDGSSNIIVDIYFDGVGGANGIEILGDSYAWNCASESNDLDNFYDYNGPDGISLPIDNLESLEDEVTISFWLYGNPEQPQNDAVFEAKDADGNRILNVHLPWSNGRIYWDAGAAGYYDRIDKAADNPEQYKGKWNHWAFTKEPSLGKMSIFLNGELWHSSTGKFQTIGSIDTLILGKGVGGGNNFYDGKIDEFRIWSVALDEATVAEWMNIEVNNSHPEYDNLLAYYQFNEEDGLFVTDEITAEIALMRGIPQRMNYGGKRIKDFVASETRPNIKFNRNTSDYSIITDLVVDSFPQGQTMIELYVQANPGDEPYLDEVIFVYPAYYNNYIYDENGIATDSTYVTPDETLVLEMIEYNTSEPGAEILIPWEVGRFITPYGNNLSLDEDGWTWVYDVTDFQHLFQGENVHMRAGNFQELLDMKIYFIEGTPPRDLLDIKNLYSTNPQLSNFDEVVVDTNVSLMPEAQMFKLKTTLSGHWFGDGNNCAEFCPNIHSVSVNGNEEYSWQIIQECGDNALYPQGGTWFYDRAGWCPGMPVTEQNLDLTPFINIGVDEEVNVDYNVEYDPYGNYVTEIHFVSYNEPNFTLDASIEEIIAPSDFKLNNRFNPICGNPIIRIKNTGSDILNSLTIEYGIAGQEVYSYNWAGSLSFLQEEIVPLPSMNVDDFYETDEYSFTVNISNPNGTTDEYEHNNINRSSFDLAPMHDFQIIVWFKTNNRVNENSYEILDTDGNVVFSRDNMGANTLYEDTLNLEPGCYEFIAYDEGGDGMYDWPSGHGNGYIKLRKADGTSLINLENWFGEYIRYNFVNTAEPLAVAEPDKHSFKIWPNPSDGKFSIELLSNPRDYIVSVYSLTGTQVYEAAIYNQTPGTHQLDLSSLSNGFYLINVKSGDFNKFKKIIIER